MATPNYDALIAKVRDWANRDNTIALPDSIIRDALDYAADEAYRLLEVAALEHTITYPTITQAQAESGKNALEVPQNLTSFIQLRKLDTDSQGRSTVYNEKTDLRSFHDRYAETYTDCYWTRQGNNILVHPNLQAEDQFELHYYRRLPALNATFSVTPTNFTNNLLVNLGATEPTAAAPVTVNNCTYTSGTPLYFNALEHRVTSYTVTNPTATTGLTLSFNVANPFSTAEQTAAASARGTTGSWERAYSVVFYEGDTLDLTNENQRRLWVHVSDGDTISPPVSFSNNGSTVTWRLYEGANAGDFRNIDFNGLLQGFNVAFLSQELINSIPATTRFTSPTQVDDDPTFAMTGVEWTTRGTGISSASTAVTDTLNTITEPVGNAFSTPGVNRRALYFFGTESFNWLRDEQEKILIFGALWHIGDYDRDNETSQLYAQKFAGEIEALNQREKMREASGGNFQIHFNGNDLI